MKYKIILLSMLLSTILLFTGCGEKEETVTAITSEQFTTLYENAKTIYAETPEAFLEDTIESRIGSDVEETEISQTEAMLIKEAIEILVTDFYSDELNALAEDTTDKAMVVAKQVGLVNANESRWDEAITKNEALNFLFRIYSNMDTITNADRGIAVGEAVDNSTGDGKFDNPYADYTTTDESLADYEVTITEELNTQLYVVKAADILKLDQEGAGGISPVEVGAYLTVTGKTSNNWYQVQWGSSVGYLPADVLSTENPHPAPSNDPSEVLPNGMTQEEFDEKVQQAISGLDESVIGAGIPEDVDTANPPPAPSYEW